MTIRLIDISAETYGKYQHCTKDRRTGLWFADVDFGFDGKVKKGALPSPYQDTPQDRERAKRMYETAAFTATNGYFKSLDRGIFAKIIGAIRKAVS